MKHNKLTPTLAIIFLFSIILIPLTSAVIVDADYITLLPGKDGRVGIEIENNENFDIEDITIQLVLGSLLPEGTIVSLPFTIVGSSEKDVDDIDEDDRERVSFNLRASTNIAPGDYNIPYILTYTNADTNNEEEKTGSFSISVSAETEIDFSVETKGEETDSAIVGKEGRVTLEIINQGLGEIKSVGVQIFPQGFSLLSKDKVFVGTVDSDDTDTASFDVIFESKRPTLNAKVTFKDFDNNEQTQTVNLPFRVFTEEEALEMGLIKKNQTRMIIGIVVAFIIAWIVYRKIKKRRKNKNKGRS